MAGSSAQITFAFLAKDAASKSINNIGRNLKGLGGVAKKIGKGIAIGIAAVGAAFVGAAIAAKGFVQAAISDLAAQTKLISILEARGLATEANIKATEDLIRAGQNLAFTDDQIRAGIATATQFTKDFTIAQRILATAQDVARAKNISLEDATTLVGKAYQGNTKGLKALGIQTKKGAKGLEVLTAVNSKFSGIAEKNSQTVSSQFEILGIKINEAKEAIGKALLPAVMKVFKALQPIADKLLGDLDKKLPDLQKFASTIADDLVKKIPGFIKTAQRELPPLIDKIKSFFLEATKFADSAVKTLGPEGTITAGIALVGAKVGGLKGALAGVLSTVFTDFGFAPFHALLLGTVSSAILAGLAQGLASQAAIGIISAFSGKLKAAMLGASTAAAAATAAGSTAAAAAGGVGAAATGAAAAVGGIGAAAVAAAVALPIAIPLLLKALGFGEGSLAVSGLPSNYKDLGNSSTGTGPQNLTVVIGAETVADAVVPVIARDFTVNPRGGR